MKTISMELIDRRIRLQRVTNSGMSGATAKLAFHNVHIAKDAAHKLARLLEMEEVSEGVWKSKS